jgi:trehalose 6-phosphate synthase
MASAGKARLRTEKANGITLATLDLTQHDYDGFYNGFSNNCLWPLLHFRIDLMRFEREEFETYRRVNARFAASLAKLLRPSDLVWVHDFHLIPLAEELPAPAGPGNASRFFLHTPFPPPEIFCTLPAHEAMTRALFAYDLIGFQTEDDLDRFPCAGTPRLPRHRAGRRNPGLQARVAHRMLPDRASTWTASIASPSRRRASREFARMASASCAVATSSSAWTASTTARACFDAWTPFGRYLERASQGARQRDPPAGCAGQPQRPVPRTGTSASSSIVEAARVNGRFGRFDWTPVHYLNRALPRRTLAGLYRASRVGLVTPMRDGMNLVAMEYVAAQDPAVPACSCSRASRERPTTCAKPCS